MANDESARDKRFLLRLNLGFPDGRRLDDPYGSRFASPFLNEGLSNPMTAREIYTKAETAARKEHARMVRQFIAGKIDICPCGMDMERDAIIDAFDKALRHS